MPKLVLFRNRSRRLVYPIAGAVLAAGAPLGLLVLRGVLARSFPTPSWIAEQVGSDVPLYVYLLVSTTVVFALLGRTLGSVEDALEQSATTDPLTGLANRRHFDACLAQEIARALRHQTPVSLLMVDVDGLKKINDVGGHEAGDAALASVAKALSESCRRTDVAARTGGDEFAVLAPMTTSTRALELAHRIRATLAQSPSERRAPTVSIGVADLESVATLSPKAIVGAADAALYVAKTTGRDRAVVAPRDPEADRRLNRATPVDAGPAPRDVLPKLTR